MGFGNFWLCAYVCKVMPGYGCGAVEVKYVGCTKPLRGRGNDERAKMVTFGGT